MSPHPDSPLSVEDVRLIATKMVRRRRGIRDREDAVQEAWVAGWLVAGKGERYVSATIRNTLNNLQRKSERQVPLVNSTVVWLEAYHAPRVTVWTPDNDIGWAEQVAHDSKDLALVQGVGRGLTVAAAGATVGLSKSGSSKRWRALRPALSQTWKETRNA